MSIKLRYSLLFVGCLAHAEFLTLTLAHDFWADALTHILWPNVFYPIWWVLVLIWPTWVVVLWKYGMINNRAIGVIVPVVLGLIVMFQVLVYLLLWISFACCGAHM